MQALRALLLLGGPLLILWAAPVHAQVTEIYKCIDPNGRPLYTSDKRDTTGKKCEIVSRQVNVAPSQAPAPRRPATFPRESANDRSGAMARQRTILEQELATESQLLDKARQELAAQEATRSGDERNYARVLERLQPYKDNVETHEKNIEALRRELGNTK
ncbi:MAG TPA: DUF4124 domain-containing protein [Burkholderiales bacterium]|nr:DUF4124 domain-containing protein [Burkholderiales bacterium]